MLACAASVCGKSDLFSPIPMFGQRKFHSFAHGPFKKEPCGLLKIKAFHWCKLKTAKLLWFNPCGQNFVRNRQKKGKIFVLWLQLSIVQDLRLKTLVQWRWISFSSMNIRMTSVVINKPWLFVSECKAVVVSQLRNHCASKTQCCSNEASTCDLFSPLSRARLYLTGFSTAPDLSRVFPLDLKYLWIQLGKIPFCPWQSA